MFYPQPESQRKEFAEKLESLLHRAYHLQEEFGSTFPADSMLLDLGEQGSGAGSLGPRTSTHQGPTAGMGRPGPHRREGSWDEAPGIPGRCALPRPLGNSPWHCCVHISPRPPPRPSRAFGSSPLLGYWVGRGVAPMEMSPQQVTWRRAHVPGPLRSGGVTSPRE